MDSSIDDNLKKEFSKIFRMCEVYYKMNAQSIETNTCALLLRHLSEVMSPFSSCRDEIIELCLPLILRLFCKYFKNIDDDIESVNPEIFTDVIYAMKTFGMSFRKYAETMDPYQNILKITKIATILVPKMIPVSITKILDALGELKIKDENFLYEAVLHLQVNLELYTLMDLAAVVRSFRKLSYYKSDKISQRLAKVIKLRNNQLTTKLVARFVVSIGHLDWRDMNETFEILIKVK